MNGRHGVSIKHKGLPKHEQLELSDIKFYRALIRVPISQKLRRILEKHISEFQKIEHKSIKTQNLFWKRIAKEYCNKQKVKSVE